MKPVFAVILTFFLFSCSSGSDKPDGGEEPVIDAGDDGADEPGRFEIVNNGLYFRQFGHNLKL